MNLLNSFGFELPTRIEYGVGAVRMLPEVLKERKARRILLVTDPGVKSAGLVDKICEYLEAAGTSPVMSCPLWLYQPPRAPAVR